MARPKVPRSLYKRQGRTQTKALNMLGMAVQLKNWTIRAARRRITMKGLDVWQEKHENMDLKEKVRKEQAKYLCVTEQRLEMQKTLAAILNAI